MVEGGSVIRIDGLLLALTDLPDRTLNVTLVEDEPGAPARALAEAREEFARHARFFGIDLPADGFFRVQAAAREAGLRPVATRPAMAIATSAAPAVAVPAGIRLERVADVLALEAVRRLQVEVFDWSPRIARRFLPDRALSWDGFSAYVAWDGDRPVATAIGHLDDEAVGIFGVGTHPMARGRGIATALTTLCIAEARPAANLAWLQATAMGRSLYERMGFRAVGDWVLWT